MPVREAVGRRPERLAENPLDPIPLDGAADFAARRDTEPDLGVLAVLAAAGKAVEHEVTGRVG